MFVYFGNESASFLIAPGVGCSPCPSHGMLLLTCENSLDLYYLERGEVVAQRSQVTCPRSHSLQEEGLELNPERGSLDIPSVPKDMTKKPASCLIPPQALPPVSPGSPWGRLQLSITAWDFSMTAYKLHNLGWEHPSSSLSLFICKMDVTKPLARLGFLEDQVYLRTSQSPWQDAWPINFSCGFDETGYLDPGAGSKRNGIVFLGEGKSVCVGGGVGREWFQRIPCMFVVCFWNPTGVLHACLDANCIYKINLMKGKKLLPFQSSFKLILPRSTQIGCCWVMNTYLLTTLTIT